MKMNKLNSYILLIPWYLLVSAFKLEIHIGVLDTTCEMGKGARGVEAAISLDTLREDASKNGLA